MYKARLRSNGEVVAVKVQRPGIGENIAIDMVLLRRLVAVVDNNIPQARTRRSGALPAGHQGPPCMWVALRARLPAAPARGCAACHGPGKPLRACRVAPQVSQPLVPLVDEFAARLFGELDYVQEGRSAEKFARLYRWVGGWLMLVVCEWVGGWVGCGGGCGGGLKTRRARRWWWWCVCLCGRVGPRGWTRRGGQMTPSVHSRRSCCWPYRWAAAFFRPIACR